MTPLQTVGSSSTLICSSLLCLLYSYEKHKKEDGGGVVSINMAETETLPVFHFLSECEADNTGSLLHFLPLTATSCPSRAPPLPSLPPSGSVRAASSAPFCLRPLGLRAGWRTASSGKHVSPPSHSACVSVIITKLYHVHLGWFVFALEQDVLKFMNIISSCV